MSAMIMYEHQGLILITFGLLLLITFSLSLWTYRKLKDTHNEKKELLNLINSFTNADDSLLYLKDENLNYVFINKRVESFYGRTAPEIIGRDDFSLSEAEFAEKRRQTDLKALQKGTIVVDGEDWNGRIYKVIKFPVKMEKGKIGVGAYKTDVTEEREREKLQEKVLTRHMILSDVFIRRFRSRDEQLQYALNQALKLTESQYGYIYYYDEEKKEFILNSWTNGVMQDCELMEKQTRYQLEKTGIWGEVVRQRKPVVVNDFEKPNPLKKGYPDGHVALKKFMSIPVIMDDKIVAVVGLANKQNDYDDNDVYEMQLLMTGIWNAVERREARINLLLERNKYLQTLFSIGDGVLVIDKDGYIEILNQVAENLTGWSLNDASGKYYKEVFQLSHEQEGMFIKDPIEEVFRTDMIQFLGNHAMLTSKDGAKYYIEDSAAPIKDEMDTTVGVVLVFRDVTEKKEYRRKIEYLSFHDPLTGLYNRRFFEEELNRLDTKRNLPISIIMGDVNGLKLTNDVFGHADGDILLKKVSEVFSRVCRVDDIIARWGGDEFVLLLPKTNRKEAEIIIERIREEFSKENVKAIKCSISMGADTKEGMAKSLIDVLDQAEERMYAVKTLDRNEFESTVIKTIIEMLHQSSTKEKRHSQNVSELSLELGKRLGLTEVELRRLKEAGYFHDIGKIAFDHKTLAEDIERHSIMGYRILHSFEETMELADLVLAHHEHWDGSGYPRGIKGEEIPILARIISIVEAYDRMLYDFQGEDVMNKNEVLDTLKAQAGKKFDPELVNLLIDMLGEE